MQVRSIKSLAIDDELNLQALSPPWRLRGGPESSKFLIKAQSFCQPACFLKPSRCLPRVTSLEQKQLPLSSSLRKCKGFQEFCVRNPDKDQIYYFQIQIISQRATWKPRPIYLSRHYPLRKTITLTSIIIDQFFLFLNFKNRIIYCVINFYVWLLSFKEVVRFMFVRFIPFVSHNNSLLLSLQQSIPLGYYSTMYLCIPRLMEFCFVPSLGLQ